MATIGKVSNTLQLDPAGQNTQLNQQSSYPPHFTSSITSECIIVCLLLDKQSRSTLHLGWLLIQQKALWHTLKWCLKWMTAEGMVTHSEVWRVTAEGTVTHSEVWRMTAEGTVTLWSVKGDSRRHGDAVTHLECFPHFTSSITVPSLDKLQAPTL